MDEQFHVCEACRDWKPEDDFSGVRLDVYVPYGIVDGVRDDDSRDERDSGGVKLHYLFAVCADCRHSPEFESWKLQTRRSMLDEYCRTLAARRHPGIK